jgi:class 3 adenylate cyclase
MEPGELLPRLVAILAADAVDYSRLMAGDDQATIRALDSAREVFRRCTASRGRVVDTAGDPYSPSSVQRWAQRPRLLPFNRT